MSADFREHPIAHLTEPLLLAHDPAEVEAFCYAEVEHPDAVSRRIAAAVAGWRSTVGLKDADVAEIIDRDRIDILVCLAGHTSGNRIEVCAMRPAPIQINMHNVSTGGLAEFDYWLTDASLHPADSTEYASETLLRLPSLYLHWQPSDAPDPSPPPSSELGPIVFGSFSNPTKLNDRVLAVWSEILKRVPDSRLRLGYRDSFGEPWPRSRVRNVLLAAGVARDRVDFWPESVEPKKHFARIASLDIALDPFPFTGGTSTFEALWMGVPVVTLAGTRFAARCGVSLLHQVGLDDLIAASTRDYVRIAAELAGDLKRRTSLRKTLRRRVVASRLCDSTSYAKSIEIAYRAMWRAWCRGDRLPETWSLSPMTALGPEIGSKRRPFGL
jgi:predicted O-linked N-acetylglucosamine transferase (SPINDLY family)